MKQRRSFTLQGVVPLLLLAACASAPPVADDRAGAEAAPGPMAVATTTPAPEATASMADAAVAAAPARQSKLKKLEKRSPYGNRRKVVRNGTEYYCSREETTGSRVKVVESCLTKEQLDQRIASGQELIDDLMRVPGEMPGDFSGGAAPISVNR